MITIQLQCYEIYYYFNAYTFTLALARCQAPFQKLLQVLSHLTYPMVS